MTYATVADLVLLYPDMENEDAGRLEQILAKASSIIRLEGGKTELTEDEQNVYSGICCDMVYSFVTQDNKGDVSQLSVTAGSMTESLSFRTPPGALRLTIPQRKLLGLNAQVISSIEARLP